MEHRSAHPGSLGPDSFPSLESVPRSGLLLGTPRPERSLSGSQLDGSEQHPRWLGTGATGFLPCETDAGAAEAPVRTPAGASRIAASCPKKHTIKR